MITQKISLDLQLSQRKPVLYAKQGDALQRQVEITFFSGGSAWNVPNTLSVRQVIFCKPDGRGGAYDTMPADEYSATREYAVGDFCWRLVDETKKYYHCTTAIGSGGEAWNAAHWAEGGESAVTISNNVATVKIAPEVLTCAGCTAMELQLMSEAGDQITSWTWSFSVAQSVESGIQSQDYWNVQSLRQMQAAILAMETEMASLAASIPQVDDTLSGSGKAADAKVTGDTIKKVSDFADGTVKDAVRGPAKPADALAIGQGIGSTGKKNTSAAKARTDLLYRQWTSGSRAVVNCSSNDYEYQIAMYDDTGNISTPTGFLGFQDNGAWHSGKTVIDASATRFVIVFRHPDSSTIESTEESTILSSLSFFALTDRTFSTPNVAADADAVGDTLKEQSDSYGLLYASRRLEASEQQAGRYSFSFSTGSPVLSYDTSGNNANLRTSSMFACPKNGRLRIDLTDWGTSSKWLDIAFFDTLDDLTSFRWMRRTHCYGTHIYEVDAQGNYFTITTNNTPVYLPPIFYKNKGDGVSIVTAFPTEEQAFYDAVRADIDDNTIVFACLADSHYNDYQARGWRQLEMTSDFARIAENLGVDFMLHLGDMIDQGAYVSDNTTVYVNELHTKEMIDRLKSSVLPFVYTQGHHEMFPIVSSGDGSNVWTFSRERCFGLLGRYADALKPVYHGSSSSCYIDFPYSKVRLIVLDSCSYGANGFSLAVCTWYEETALATVPTGYSVVIASHCAPIQYAGVTVSNGSNITDATLQFIEDGGNVLCHIHGHYHVDNYNVVSDGTYSYLLISQGCACVDATSSAPTGMDHPTPASTRNAGEYSEYLFDVYCLHRDTGKVKAFRFGGGSSKDLSAVQSVQTWVNHRYSPTATITLTGATQSIAAVENTVYQCGELTSLTISSFPATGRFWIWFTSGATPTTTVGISNFTAEANKKYRIYVEDGCATYDSWATS